MRVFYLLAVSPKACTARTVAAAAALALSMLAPSCSDLPRDPDGTTERIGRSGTMLVGVVAGSPPSPQGEAVLARVGRELGARPDRISGQGEELLEKLEKGELDLVYGHFAMASPWSRNVHFGRPLTTREIVGKDERVPRFAFRNGENGWIMRVEREIVR